MGAIPDYETAIQIINEQDERIAKAEARNKALEEALDWVTRAYKRTLDGKPVRNADEILSCADAALREDR